LTDVKLGITITGKVYIFSYIPLSRLCISGKEHEKYFQKLLFLHFCSLKKHTRTFCLCKSDLPVPDVTVIVSGR
jgi:hypothetical protein